MWRRSWTVGAQVSGEAELTNTRLSVIRRLSVALSTPLASHPLERALPADSGGRGDCAGDRVFYDPIRIWSLILCQAITGGDNLHYEDF